MNRTNRLRRGEATIGASFLAAYLECSPEIQAVVREMIDIINSDDSDPDDLNAAVNTLCEALWPSAAAEIRDADVLLCQSDDMAEVEQELGREQDAFANRVRALMKDKGLSQEQLARSAGITQPAVANILNRRCRPQRRTVARFAAALGVEPEQLWPST
jgi:lambda repressor-like predicted transcriptional regulator